MSGNDNKVVFLRKAPRKKDAPIETVTPPDGPMLSVLGCGNCNNKTWALVYTGDNFPKLQCCVCGQACGHMGWVDHDEE